MNTLNDMSTNDFESFAVDIAKIYFNNSLIHGYSEGPDGGIDGIDDSLSPCIIVQAKRENKTSAQIVKTFQGEIEKIKRTQKKRNYSSFQYVIVTSSNITADGQFKIREAAGALMNNDKNIIDANRIHEFSNQPEYYEVFKNYKLIEVNLMDQIEKSNRREIEIESQDFFGSFDPKYFVETEMFDKAYGVILKEKVVLLHGNPGVGKSTTSKMLAMAMFNRTDRQYSIVKRDIEDCKNLITEYNRYYRNHDGIALVVVIDDFLGRNYVDVNDREIKKVIDICSLSKKSKSLYIILNCRTQIIKSIKNDNIEFNKLISQKTSGIKTSIIAIDLTATTEKEKALILRKNFELTYKKINNKSDKDKFEVYYNDLRNEINYTKIINSKNWNPRVIDELTTNWENVKLNLKDTFSDYMMSVLNNPHELYEELFERLSTEEKNYLFNLIFFSSYPVDQSIVRDSFVANCLSNTEDIKVIENKLDGSWITFQLYNNFKIDFTNPSIIDYLLDKESTTPHYQEIIQKNTPFLKQIPKIIGHEKLYNLIEKNIDRFKDSDDFIGEQISVLLKNLKTDNLTTDNKKKFSNLLCKFEGSYYSSEGKGSIRLKSWLSILKEIYFLHDEIDQFFFHELMYSDNSEIIIDNILSSSRGEIDDIAEILDSIIEEVSGEGLSQNEIIDFGEERTGINLYVAVIEAKEMELQEYLDNLLVADFAEGTLDQVNDRFDIIECIELCVEKVKENIEESLNPIFSDISLDDEDFDYVRDAASDYISEYILPSEEKTPIFETYRKDADIDYIINRPLSESTP